MRLLIADADQTDVNSALSSIDAPGASVLMNPQWITPDPSEQLWIACGKPALLMIQAAGWIPKKGGVVSNRGKLFQNVQPDGWSKSINVGVSYAPQIMHIDYSDFVKFQCDIAIYRRFENTGSIDPVLGHYTYTKDLSGVLRYLKKQHKATGKPVEISLDLETEGLDPFNPDKKIVSVSASAKEGISDVVYCKDYTNQEILGLITQLQWIASQPWIKVIGANFKYDMLWMRVKWQIVFTNFTFDTCNGGSLIEENRPNTLNIHTKVYSPDLGGYDDHFNATHDKSKMGEVAPADLLPYAGGDTDACLRNYHKIRAQLLTDNPAPSGKPAKNSLTSMYVNVVQPAISALHKMELTGACVAVEKFHEFGSDLENRMKETQAHAASVLPKALMDKYGGLDAQGGAPLSKPNMIAEFLFSPTGLNLKPLQVTEKTQKPSTAQHHLEQFKDHPDAAAVIERYLDYKRVAKMHGTYYKGFLRHLRSDGRWHASYIIHKQGDDKNNEQSAAGTVTGRGSATNPAFQCVTGDTEVFTREGITHARRIIDHHIGNHALNPFIDHKMDIYGTGGWNQTSNLFKSWRHDILRVRFGNGNELKCTPEHPFMTKRGWVAAKELTLDDYLPIPSKAERVDCSHKWLTPVLAEALGLITAVGNLQMSLPNCFIELPPEEASWLAGVMVSELATPCLLDHVDNKILISFVFDWKDDTNNQLLLFLLALPTTEGPPIWEGLRGTTRMVDFFRGFLRPIETHYRPNGGKPKITAKVPRKALALALLRETTMEGRVPPTIVPTRGGFKVEWRNQCAAYMANWTGVNPYGWEERIHASTKYQDYESLRVVEIEGSGADWVYDFTVPTTHDFIANGVLVHNTVPKHSYWGKRLRECIVAPDGYVIVARDYSQGELRVAACWAGETQMIKAYQAGIDLHSLTAATVNGMSYEEAMYLKANDYPKYEKFRQSGKAGNFGLIYGMGAYGFMMYADQVYGVKMTIEEAEAMRDAYFALYPGLVAWHARQIMEATQTGYVRSPLGRTRHLPTINSPIKKVRETTQRQAINSPIQATLVDFMWMSMGIIERQKPSLLVPFAQIHDQGLWYTPEDRVDEALQFSGEVMENLPLEEKFGWKPELAFTTDAEVGMDLAGLEKVAG